MSEYSYSWAPRDAEGNFLKIELNGSGVDVSAAEAPDLWTDRERFMLDSILELKGKTLDVTWAKHYEDIRLNGPTYVLVGKQGGYYSVTRDCERTHPTAECWFTKEEAKALRAGKRDPRQHSMGLLGAGMSGYYRVEEFSNLEIDVIHRKPDPEDPENLIQSDGEHDATCFDATVKITYPLTLREHTMIEEIDDRDPATLDDVIAYLQESYPATEPDVDTGMRYVPGP